MAELDELSNLKQIAIYADELCDAVDNATDDVGGSRPGDEILKDIGPLLSPPTIDRYRNELERLATDAAASPAKAVKGRIENWIFDGKSVVGTLYGTKLGHADKIKISPQISGPIGEDGVAQTHSGFYALGRPAWLEDEPARILWGLVHNVGRVFDRPRPLWSAIVETVGIGSGEARKLCERYEMDPETSVGEFPDDETGRDQDDEAEHDAAIDRLEYDAASGEERAPGDNSPETIAKALATEQADRERQAYLQGALDMNDKLRADGLIGIPPSDKEKADLRAESDARGGFPIEPPKWFAEAMRRAWAADGHVTGERCKTLADFDAGNPRPAGRPTYAAGVLEGLKISATLCDFIATPIEDQIKEFGIHGPHQDGPQTVRKVEHILRQWMK